MNEAFVSFPFRDDNLKSKIKKRPHQQKWMGPVALALTFFFGDALGQAQQPRKVPRIAFLSVQSRSVLSSRFDAFRKGLRDVGHVDGKSIVIDYLDSAGSQDRLPAVVAELVHRQPDIIVTGGSQATRAAIKGTSTIPIVMAQDNDPLGAGFVTSLAHPGGNVTGLANLAAELSGKQLELLREILPKLARLAVLSDTTEPGHPQAVQATDAAANGFGVKVFYMCRPKRILTRRFAPRATSALRRCW